MDTDFSRLTLNELRSHDAETIRSLHRAEMIGQDMAAADMADRSTAIRKEITRRLEQPEHLAGYASVLMQRTDWRTITDALRMHAHQTPGEYARMIRELVDVIERNTDMEVA